MSDIFHRPELAKQMAQQLLHPGVLDEDLRSGLFLSGLRRTGKTTFLLNDLVPALEAAGALVIYVDLWSDTRTSPAVLVQDAVRKTLAELQTPASALAAKLQRLSGLDVGALTFKLGFKLEKVGAENGTTLAQRRFQYRPSLRPVTLQAPGRHKAEALPIGPSCNAYRRSQVAPGSNLIWKRLPLEIAAYTTQCDSAPSRAPHKRLSLRIRTRSIG